MIELKSRHGTVLQGKSRLGTTKRCVTCRGSALGGASGLGGARLARLVAARSGSSGRGTSGLARSGLAWQTRDSAQHGFAGLAGQRLALFAVARPGVIGRGVAGAVRQRRCASLRDSLWQGRAGKVWHVVARWGTSGSWRCPALQCRHGAASQRCGLAERCLARWARQRWHGSSRQCPESSRPNLSRQGTAELGTAGCGRHGWFWARFGSAHPGSSGRGQDEHCTARRGRHCAARQMSARSGCQGRARQCFARLARPGLSGREVAVPVMARPAQRGLSAGCPAWQGVARLTWINGRNK
jgi:hypothetical protein